MKQSWKFAKPAEAENESQTAEEKRREERKRNSEKIEDVPAEKETSLDSALKVTSVYDARL